MSIDSFADPPSRRLSRLSRRRDGRGRLGGLHLQVPPSNGSDAHYGVMAGQDSASLAEVLDRILDKGLVVDVWARVSVVGIEILTVEARVVAASVDTFLHYTQGISKIEEAAESDELDDMRELEIETPTRPEAYEQTPTG